MKAITHSGKFHGDDVFGAALIKLVYPDIEIIRVNKVPEEALTDPSIIVFDIGEEHDPNLKNFDHHQELPYAHDDDTPYAAFGLLWEEYCLRLCSNFTAAMFIEEDLVIPIDEQDNGICSNPLSKAVSNFMLPGLDIDECFNEAVEFAYGVLRRAIINAKVRAEASNKVFDLLNEQRTEDGEPSVLVMDEYIQGWQQSLVYTNVEFVLSPSLRGGYNLLTVPAYDVDFAPPKIRFPEAWAEDISSAGIEGLTFCHKAGFILAGDSKEALLQAADLLL